MRFVIDRGACRKHARMSGGILFAVIAAFYHLWNSDGISPDKINSDIRSFLM
jgi:hypothetical protein